LIALISNRLNLRDVRGLELLPRHHRGKGFRRLLVDVSLAAA
jgi:hypothetical protein